MRPLPDELVFDRSALRRLGWTDSAIGRATSSRRLAVLSHGWFTRPGNEGERAVAVAAAKAISGAVISHRTAAVLHSVPIVGERPHLPELTVPPSTSGSDRRAILHRAELRERDVVVLFGVRVTSLARTLIDLARSQRFSMSVAAIDSALFTRKVTRAQLERTVAESANWPGITRAREALQLSNGRAESPLESISRLAFPTLGIPEPRLQVVIEDRDGFEVARLDFYWDRYGVGGEADGRGKYDGKTYTDIDGRDVYDGEKQRENDAETERLVFARWGWKHIWPRGTVARRRIESAFARGATLDRAEVPRLWTPRYCERI